MLVIYTWGMTTVLSLAEACVVPGAHDKNKTKCRHLQVTMPECCESAVAAAIDGSEHGLFAFNVASINEMYLLSGSASPEMAAGLT